MTEAPANQGEEFLRLARDKGLLSPDQVRECIRISAQLEEIGMPEDIPDIAVKKGFLSEADKKAVLKELAHEEEAFPFEIGEEIGQGAIGVVYKAKQKSLDRPIALKMLKQEFAQDATLVGQFLTEARSSAKFNHVNVVQGLDAGPYKATYYFAMELVEGPPLEEILRKRKLKVNEAVSIAIQTARALEYAEKVGVVHRDIKPDNILVARDGTTKVCDLGMARLSVSEDVIKAGLAVGTPYYMSPEQARGSTDVDIRSDIYSLGATLYHALTGEPPFKGKKTQDVLRSQLTETVRDPREINPKVPGDLAKIIAKMMAKDPRHRYGHPKDVQRDLELFSAGKPPKYALDFAAESTVALRRDVKRAAKQYLPYALGAGLLVVVVTAAVLLFGGGEPSGPPLPPLPPDAGRPEPPTDVVVTPDRSGDEPEMSKAEKHWKYVLSLIADHPDDDERNIDLLKSAIEETKGTEYAEAAQKKIDAIVKRRQDEVRAETDKIKGAVEALLAADKISEARDRVGELIPPAESRRELVRLRQELYQNIDRKIADVWKPYSDRYEKELERLRFKEARGVLKDLADHPVRQLRDRAKEALKKIDDAEKAEEKRKAEAARRAAEERREQVDTAREDLKVEIAWALTKRDLEKAKDAIRQGKADYAELGDFLDICGLFPSHIENTIELATETLAASAGTVTITWRGQKLKGKVASRQGETIYLATTDGMQLPIRVQDTDVSEILLLAGLPKKDDKQTYLVAASVSMAYGDNERARRQLALLEGSKEAAVLAELLDAAEKVAFNEEALALLGRADTSFDNESWGVAETLYRKAAMEYREAAAVKKRMGDISSRVYRCFAQGEDPWKNIYAANVEVIGPAVLRLTYDFAGNRKAMSDWNRHEVKASWTGNGVRLESEGDKEARYTCGAYLTYALAFSTEGHFKKAADNNWMGFIAGQRYYRFWLNGGGSVWAIAVPDDWKDQKKKHNYNTPAVADKPVSASMRMEKDKSVLYWEKDVVDSMDYSGPGMPIAVNFRGEYTMRKAVIDGTVDPATIKQLILRYHLEAAKDLENGVDYSYFASRKFEDPVGNEARLNMDFKFDGKPVKDAPEDGFSIRMTGQLLIPEDGEYIFYSMGNGTFRLFLQGKPVLLRRGDAQAESKALKLKRGVVPVVAEYIDAGGDAISRLEWSGPDMEKRPVPPIALLRNKK
ncbi:MAG: protein kinase [Planctomycetes bacterium]|nr:protein kinase [Planctomycetota bacterium]